MNAFTIKDLESLSGVKAHTIRIWEQRYSFLKPKRTPTNIRYYSGEELKTILNIALLNKYGFKISSIDKMSPPEICKKLLSLTHATAQQEKLVNDLIHCMIDLDMDRFEDLLDSFIIDRGIDRAINYLVFPFLDKIGILWQTNHIIPAQEHLVTNIIRQKLIAGMEQTNTHLSVNKTVLLFLPEGEHHELGLLYVFYLMKSRGLKVLYLGANVPLKDLEYVLSRKKPDQLYTHITCIAGNFKFDKFITQLKQHTNIPLVISGRFTQHNLHKVPSGIIFKRSLPEVVEYVASFK